MVLVSIWFPYASTIFSIRYTTIFPHCGGWGVILMEIDYGKEKNGYASKEETQEKE